MFDHYRIPRENLLNKTGDVSPAGNYVSPYKDPNKRFGRTILRPTLLRVLAHSRILLRILKIFTICYE